MDLPQLEAGMAILAEQINKISREVRSNALSSVIGGSFVRAPGGTNVTINRQPMGSSGGGVGVCPFRVTDASIGTTLKVQVQTGTVLTPTGARYPDGMSIEEPPFYLEISETCFIYCKISYIENTVTVMVESTGITLLQSATALPNTVDDEYVLLATLVVNPETVAITQISNVCLPVAANPCNLNWA